jgi:hypothetical protein
MALPRVDTTTATTPYRMRYIFSKPSEDFLFLFFFFKTSHLRTDWGALGSTGEHMTWLGFKKQCRMSYGVLVVVVAFLCGHRAAAVVPSRIGR